MRVVVAADTHSRSSLPQQFLAASAAADLVVHAGDLCSLEVLAQLQAVAPVAAVWGNNDEADVRRLLPERFSLRLAGFHIEIIHGHQGRTAMATARAVAAEIDGPGIVIFGHSHRVCQEMLGDVLLLNPGSPTHSRFSRVKSFAVLALRHEFSTEIVMLR